jgi:hypothetical protein
VLRIRVGSDPDAAVSLLRSLERNRSLRRLTLALDLWPFGNFADPSAVGAALRDLVANNRTLTQLGIGAAEWEWAVPFVARGLEHNRDLQVLNFSLLGPGEMIAAGATVSEEIANALRNHNTTLTEIRSLRYVDADSQSREIEWLLSLNEYRRQLMVDPGQVPAGLWTHVLDRIRRDGRADVMYHYVNRLVRRSAVSVSASSAPP